MTENEIRDRIVNLCKSYQGIKQGSPTHHAIIDRYNSRKPLPRGYKVTYDDFWCATYISSIAIECGYDDIIPIECSCNKMIAIAKNMGIWVENDDYVPTRGDLVMYDWQDTGKGDCVGEVEHVGMVTYIATNTFVVFEGNKNRRVDSRVMPMNGKYIRGFITPNYKSKATNDFIDYVKIDVVARDCIKGKYGNNPQRAQKLREMGYNPDEVQARINELLKN